MRFSKSKTHLDGRNNISLPDMAPFAGVIFLVVYFFALTTQFKEPRLGNVATEKLPYSKIHTCMPENTELVIGLDTAGHYSFSVAAPIFQTTTIQKVAAKQGIVFSESQLSNLNQLDYLDIPIHELPAILTKPRYKQESHMAGKQPALSEREMLECLITSKRVVQSLAHKPSYVSLLIDGETSCARVMQLFDSLQGQGLNRFNLKTQNDQRSIL
jgi:biopolymer transport protein ExbD